MSGRDAVLLPISSMLWRWFAPNPAALLSQDSVWIQLSYALRFLLSLAQNARVCAWKCADLNKCSSVYICSSSLHAGSFHARQAVDEQVGVRAILALLAWIQRLGNGK